MSARKIKNILISQPQPSGEKSPYYDIAKKYQVNLTFRPMIKIERVSVKEFRQQRINILDFSATIMTSRKAVDSFFSLCQELKIDIPETIKYFCVSESIALYLQKYIIYRKRKIFFSETGKIEGLATAFAKHPKENFIIPVTDNHNEDILLFLDGNKLKYTKSVMYRTVSNDFGNDEKFEYDMVIFFSPTGVDALRKNFPDFVQGDIAFGCFGCSTAKAIEYAGFRLDLKAPQGEYTSMTAALDAFLKANKKK